MNWRWWLSAIVIALLVTAATMCIRTLWMTDWVGYSRTQVSGLSADSTEQFWKRERLCLFSSSGQLIWTRLTFDANATAAVQESGFSAATVPRTPDPWKWVDLQNTRNWQLLGFGVRADSSPFQYFAVSVPYWAVIGALATTLVILVRSGRSERRSRRGQCPKCAYDVRGEFKKGCPECGWNRPAATSPQST